VLINYKEISLEKNIYDQYLSHNKIVTTNNEISNNPELNDFNNRKSLINMNRYATDFNISLEDFNVSKLIKLFATKMDHVSIR